MRRQCGEVRANGRVILEAGADEDAVPFPAARLRRLDEEEHQPLVQVRGKPAEHSLCEEARMFFEGLEDPLVVERLHDIAYVLGADSAPGGSMKGSTRTRS